MRLLKQFTFILITFININLYAQLDASKVDSISFYLSKVMITANRYEKNVFETNIPVNMVHEKEIWQQGVDNLGDILQQKAGVTFSSAGLWSQKMVIRGLAGPQVLTLIDGMRLEVLRSYGSHAPLIDVNQIERVEIIRGPASILYGSDAIAGVINFITKKTPITNSGFILNGNIGLQYCSNNQQYNEHIKLSTSYRNWSFLIGYNNRKAEDINTPQGKLSNSGFKGYTIDTKIGFQPAKRHYLRLTGQTNRLKDVGVPISEYAKSAKFLKYNRDLITLSYEYRAPKNLWTYCKANIFYQQGERNFDAFIYQKPKGSLFVNQTLNAHRDVNSYGANFQNSFSIFNKNLLTTGVDFFANADDTRRTADPEIYNSEGIVINNPPADNTPPTPKSNRNGIGVFIEDEYTPWFNWTFTMGTRFDYIVSNADATAGTLTEENRRETDRDVSANFGALYRLTENIHLIGNIGRAFKAPTLQERYFKGTAQVGYLYGNPELKSELSLNIDAGIKWEADNLTGEFNLFRNQVDNLIVMNPISAKADTFLYDNVGKAEIYGGEFQAQIRISPKFSFFMNSAYVHGHDVNAAEPLPKMPPFEGRLGLRYQGLKNSYWLEITARFVDSQQRVAENEMETSSYNVFNFSSGIDLAKILNFRYPLFMTANVKNIFDESYRDHLSSVTWWDAAGRNIVVGLRSNF